MRCMLGQRIVFKFKITRHTRVSQVNNFYEININIDAKSLLMHRWFRRKIEQKCLEILLLLYFGYFGIRPSKGIEEQNCLFF